MSWGKIFKSILAIFIVVGFIWIAATRIDPDLGWHLRVGELTLQTRTVPVADAFSFSMAGYHWVDHEWLVEAALAWLKGHHLWPVAVIFFGLLAAAPFVVWLRRYKNWFELWFVGFLAVLMSEYIGIRPQVISFFFFFLIFELCLKRYVARGSKKIAQLVLLIFPVMFWVWANLHAGFAAGLATWALFLLASLYQSFTRRDTEQLRNLSVDLLSFVLSVVATLLNPYGLHLYGEIFRVFVSSDTARYINEWQPLISLPGLFDSPWLSLSVFASITLLAGVYVWLIARYYRKYPLPLILVNLIFFLAFVKSIKYGPFFFLSVMPLFSLGFVYLWQDIKAARDKFPFLPRELQIFSWLKIGLVFFLACLLLAAAVSAGPMVYPQQATLVLHQLAGQNQVGNLFNFYGWGGYLIWTLPEVPVFIDGRMPHWLDPQTGYSAMADYVKVFYPRSLDHWEWQDVFARNRIATVLIPNSNCSNKTVSKSPAFLRPYLAKLAAVFGPPGKNNLPCLFEAALKQQGWQTVYRDNVALIFQHESK
jgi:hypothetical protein